MKFWLGLGTLILALASGQTTNAAALSPADFDLISVVPRSPDIKPLIMPIPAKEPDRQIASKEKRLRLAGDGLGAFPR